MKLFVFKDCNFPFALSVRFISVIYSRNDIQWTICYLCPEASQKKTARESAGSYSLVSDSFWEWLLGCVVQVTPVSREWTASFILGLGIWQRDGGIGGKDRRKIRKMRIDFIEIRSREPRNRIDEPDWKKLHVAQKQRKG